MLLAVGLDVDLIASQHVGRCQDLRELEHLVAVPDLARQLRCADHPTIALFLKMREDVEVIGPSITDVDQPHALRILWLDLVDHLAPYLRFAGPLAAVHPMYALFLLGRTREEFLPPHADHMPVLCIQHQSRVQEESSMLLGGQTPQATS